jgi:hypothetical protein
MAIFDDSYPTIENTTDWFAAEIIRTKCLINDVQVAIQLYYRNGAESYSIDSGQTKQSKKSITTLQKELFQFVNYLQELELHSGVRSGTIQVRPSCYVHDEDTAI